MSVWLTRKPFRTDKLKKKVSFIIFVIFEHVIMYSFNLCRSLIKFWLSKYYLKWKNWADSFILFIYLSNLKCFWIWNLQINNFSRVVFHSCFVNRLLSFSHDLKKNKNPADLTTKHLTFKKITSKENHCINYFVHSISIQEET